MRLSSCLACSALFAMTGLACSGSDPIPGTGGGGSDPSTTVGMAGQSPEGPSTTDVSSGGSGVGGSEPMTSCEEICAKYLDVDDELNCAYDGSSCIGDCAKAFQDIDPACVDEAEAFNDCIIAQPNDDFQCAPDASITLSSSSCDGSLGALMTCLSGG